MLRQLAHARFAVRSKTKPLPLVGAVSIGLAPTTASALGFNLLRYFPPQLPLFDCHGLLSPTVTVARDIVRDEARKLMAGGGWAGVARHHKA